MNKITKANILYNGRKKSVLIAYLIGLFLGGIGGHYFYLDNNALGALMVGSFILTILTCVIFPPFLLFHCLLVLIGSVHTYLLCNKVNKQIYEECLVLSE